MLLDNDEIRFNFLRKPQYKDVWDQFIDVWIKSYHARNKNSKSKDDGGWWQYTEFPCLEDERAPLLVSIIISWNITNSHVSAYGNII